MTMSESVLEKIRAATASIQNAAISEQFPEIEPNVEPLGNKVLVQIMLPREKSAGGVYYSDDTQDANADSTQVAKVLSCGAVAFCNQGTGVVWPEGKWVEPGDFVRIPRHGGDRFRVRRGSGKRDIELVLIKDFDLIAKVTGDPTKMISYV